MECNDTQLGLGKASEYERQNEQAAKERRKLETEREETPELARARHLSAGRIETTAREVAVMNRPFYCAVCDKQYKNTMEMQVGM